MPFSPIILPIQWGEQDLFAHVNNVTYFRWFESARVAYLQQCGLWSERGQGIGSIVANINCNFREQLTHPDTIEVNARVTRIGRSSLTMEHEIRSQAQGVIVADASSVIVAFDFAAQASVPVPPEIRRAIEAIEGRAF